MHNTASPRFGRGVLERSDSIDRIGAVLEVSADRIQGYFLQRWIFGGQGQEGSGQAVRKNLPRRGLDVVEERGWAKQLGRGLWQVSGQLGDQAAGMCRIFHGRSGLAQG